MLFRSQEGRQATRAGGVRSGVGSAGYAGMCFDGRAARLQAQSAQGMGALKRRAVCPLEGFRRGRSSTSGEARGVGRAKRGAGQRKGCASRLSSACISPESA